jgi:hypothetical protein
LEEKLYLAEQKQNEYLRGLVSEEESYIKLNMLLCDISDCYFTLGVKAGAKICIELLK